MAWVLIFLATGPNGSIAAVQQEFFKKETCEAALLDLRTQKYGQYARDAGGCYRL